MTDTLNWMNRAIVICCLAGGWLASPALAAEPASRPNFLFVYTDDQRWDAMGVVQREQGERARFPWLTTPNLDRLAQGGTRFRNAFVTMSLCAPSRAVFLTGRYNHLNGVANNHTPFPTDSVTYASLLRTAGYTTGYVGKWHMDTQTERPGFDFSASFVAQGRYFDCPILVNGQETPSKGWVDDVSTDYALDFLKKNRSRPFALVVGFKTTHGPFDPPERAEDRFAGDEARPVPNLNVPAIYQSGIQAAPRRAARQAANKRPAQSGMSKGGTNLGYFRCISAADENLGRLLDSLDALDLAKNTVVIFTSDNGYYLGEHRLGDKRTAYDESLRIPMLIRWPGHLPEGQTQDAMVLNLDVAPTLLDLAGLTPPSTMQGRSWRPLLAGKASDWRHAFFYEYFREGRVGGAPTVFAVRTESAKLIKYPGHPEWTELFDLAADPYETKNLFNDPAASAKRSELEAEYARQQKAVDFVTPAYADELARPQELAKPLDAWVLDYRFDQDQGDKVVDASGRGNDGRAKDAPLETRGGVNGRRFSGHSVIDVRKSPSLDPAVRDWTMEVTFAADSPDGILLAQGGQSFGYCLALEDGRPVLIVNGGGDSTRIASKSKLGTTRTTVRAGISSEKAWIAVDGKPEAEGPLRAALSKQPQDSLQIGDDLRSIVISGDKPPGFTGLIEAVRLYSGAAPALGQ